MQPRVYHGSPLASVRDSGNLFGPDRPISDSVEALYNPPFCMVAILGDDFLGIAMQMLQDGVKASGNDIWRLQKLALESPAAVLKIIRAIEEKMSTKDLMNMYR